MANQYKVGDKVLVVNNTCSHFAEIGEILTLHSCIGEIRGRTAWRSNEHGGYIVEQDIKPFHNYNKIVITTDGKTTTAKLYENNKVIKTATANCSPEDEFDFKVGAELAVNRLISKPCGTVKAPQYYNGKVVCIKNTLHDDEFTIGKVYEIKDGKFTDNYGTERPAADAKVKTLDDLKNDEYFKKWFYKFIPFVEN